MFNNCGGFDIYSYFKVWSGSWIDAGVREVAFFNSPLAYLQLTNTS